MGDSRGVPANREMGGERSESKRSEGRRSDGERSDGESIEERWKRTMRQVAVPLLLKTVTDNPTALSLGFFLKLRLFFILTSWI